ncbi:ribonuclease P protein subunit p21-like [Ptychodera flava]|uniref:ribonuclease P protein subunit p21-like n=1 Tax=Ptychodera flava TaxID=63121 RepID=UPI00396A4C5C
MAKNSKKKSKVTNSTKRFFVPNREAFQRMNFLYQAAHCTLVHNPDNVELARFYITTMRTIAKRLVLRIDPSIKRTICKKCNSLLVPGVTATVRMRAKREQHLVVACLSCKAVKRFLAREGYQLWSEKTELRVGLQMEQTQTANQTSESGQSSQTTSEQESK